MTRPTAIPSSQFTDASDDYFQLVQRWPLRPIRNNAQYAAAAEMLDSLVLRELSEGEADYMEALSLLIEDYDRRHQVFDTSDRTPLDMLHHLVDANDMTVSELGEVLGSKGVASEVLSGKRGLSKSHILKLARRFHVEPSLFLEKIS
jgi:HTH-type transcriptional regulator/antitoxin HigA